MFSVLHPVNPVLINFVEYKELALQQNALSHLSFTPGRCPVCKRNMTPRSGGGKDDGHFYHADSAFCPTKEPSARPYLLLRPTVSDPAVTAANIQFAKDNIEKIYSKVWEMTKYLSVKNEFIEILKIAKHLNVYAYANLKPEYLPYIYVTLINFLPSKSYKKQRKLKFLFFYESKINSFEELWIDRGFDSELYRISYNGNSTQKIKKIETETDYLLTAPRYTLTQKNKDECLKHV
jgi:hypothetical protein